MRKLGILIILTLILIAIVLFYSKQPKSTLNATESEFAVADTSLIDKIFIADKGDKEVLLKRQAGGKWVVNDKYKARKGSIDLLLETIKRIRPKHPVANAAHNNVVSNMAGNAKKVEIYQKGMEQPVKTYYIGGTNLEKNANYVLLEDAKQPYAVHIPGFTGYISTRYILKEIDWRDRTIFAIRPEKIKNINLQYPIESKKGFQLDVLDKQNFVVQALNNKNAKPIALKPSGALNYLQAFRFLACEAYLDEYTRIDSLLKQTPKNILTVELNDGSKQQLDIYYIPVNKRSKTQFDQEGKRVPYDVDRYYAIKDNSNEVLLIQDYVFGKVLTTLEVMKQMGVNPPKKGKQPNVSKTKKPNKAKNEKLKTNKNKPKSNLKERKSESDKPSSKKKTKPALKEDQTKTKKSKLDTVSDNKKIPQKTPKKTSQKPN